MAITQEQASLAKQIVATFPEDKKNLLDLCI